MGTAGGQVCPKVPLPRYAGGCGVDSCHSRDRYWREWEGWAPYHGRIDFAGIHIHPADVIEGVYVSFLKKNKAK